MSKRKLKRKYKTYTDPYAQHWYEAIYNPYFVNNSYTSYNNTDVGYNEPPGSSKFQRKQAALNAADYIESMYRYHQRKYLHNRDSVENNPNFIGPISPKNYISPTTKRYLQLDAFDPRLHGTYNDNYPNMPTDYDKYKFGGNKRIKNNRKKGLAGTTAMLISSGLAALTGLITSGISAANQRRIAEENNRNQTLAANFQNSITAQTNQQQALNYNRDNELETIKTGTLNTINSNFKCGGKRRMKKAGGCITSSISKLGRYI